MSDGAVKQEIGASGENGISEPENFRKIFVGGLTSNTSDEMMREFYSKFGSITDIIVMRDPATKRSRGFGFVTFSSKSEVDEAMKNRPHVIDNKTIDPKRAVPRDDKNRSESNISTKRLYVSGIREDHTEAMLSEYFLKYGNVTKTEIINDKATNKPRGFGFVTFDDHDSVDQCVLQKSHTINNHRCDVKKGLSKEDMNKAQMSRDREGRGGRSREGGQRMGGGYGGGGSYGGPGPRSGGPGGWGGPQGGYGDYNQGGWGGQQQGGWGGQQQGGWGNGPQQGGWGGPQGGSSWGGPQQGGWGNGPQQGGWGGQSGAQQWAHAQGGRY